MQPNTTGPGCSVEVKNIREKNMKFIFYFSAAKSVSLASIAHGTIYGSNTGTTTPAFVNFKALQSVTASVEVPKRTLEEWNFLADSGLWNIPGSTHVFVQGMKITMKYVSDMVLLSLILGSCTWPGKAS
jgi:hypothetical protein